MDVQAARDGIDKVLRILGSEYLYPQPIVRYLQEARAALEETAPVSLPGDEAAGATPPPSSRKRRDELEVA